MGMNEAVDDLVFESIFSNPYTEERQIIIGWLLGDSVEKPLWKYMTSEIIL